MKKYASYSEEFKQSIVNLYRNRKPSGEIFKECGNFYINSVDFLSPKTPTANALNIQQK